MKRNGWLNRKSGRTRWVECVRCKVVEAPWVHRLDDFGVCQACREIREREVDVYGMRIRHTGQ